MNSSSFVVDNSNDENFFGTTTASAITGGNTASSTASGHGDVVTGLARSSSKSYTAANQTRVGGASVHFIFRVWGKWNGTVVGLPRDLIAHQTDYGFEIVSGPRQRSAGSTGILNSSSGDAFAAANVINMVNTNIVNRNWILGIYNIYGDFNGDINFGGSGPDLTAGASVSPASAEPNSEVQYQFSVTNNGNSAATDVTLSASYDRSLVSLSQVSSGALETTAGIKWNVGTLLPGDLRTYTAKGLTRLSGLPTGSTVSASMKVQVASKEHDQNDSDNTKTAVLSIIGASASTGAGSGTESGTGSGSSGSGSSSGTDSGTG